MILGSTPSTQAHICILFSKALASLLLLFLVSLFFYFFCSFFFYLDTLTFKGTVDLS